MKKLVLLPALVIFSATTLIAQTKKPAANTNQAKVKAAAADMSNALVHKNYAAFVATTHPKVVAMTDGGLPKLAEDMARQVSTMEKSGNTIISAWPGEPSQIVDTADQLQCTIPQYMKLKIGGGLLTTKTTLLCFSMDDGKRWYFVDATDKSLSDWRSVFPELSSKLVIPKQEEPKFEADEDLKKAVNKYH